MPCGKCALLTSWMNSSMFIFKCKKTFALVNHMPLSAYSKTKHEKNKKKKATERTSRERMKKDEWKEVEEMKKVGSNVGCDSISSELNGKM